MSTLKPLDQGTFALLKKAYIRHMIEDIMMAKKASDNIAELAKEVTILVAVLNTKVAWDAVPEEAIQNCFRWHGIHKDMCQLQASEYLHSPQLISSQLTQSPLLWIYGLWGLTTG